MPRAVKLALLPALVLGLVVLGAAIWRPARPDYTTRSREAYKLFLRGDERQNAFQWTEAEEALRKAVALDPDFAVARAVLAGVLAGHGREQEAEIQAKKADSLAALLPRETERLLIQLRLCDVMKQYSGERDSLLAILEKRLPKNPTVLNAKAYAANIRGDEAAEEAAWKELLRVDPNQSRAYNWLGYAAARKGRYEEALSYLRRYAFLSPDLANPHDSMGEILLYKGDYEAAEQELRQALQIQPEFFYSLFSLARLYLEQGRIQKGHEILEQLRSELAGTGLVRTVDVRAFNIYTYNNLNDLMVSLVKRSLAEKVSLEGEVSEIFQAVLLLHEGRYEEGQAKVDAIAEKYRQRPPDQMSENALEVVETRTHVFGAKAAEAQNDMPTAAAEWGRAVAASRRRPPYEIHWLQLNYGMALLRTGDANGAREQAQAILTFNPRLPAALLLLARADAALGVQDEARAVLERLRGELTKADADWPVRTAAEALRAQLGLAPAS